jgi:FAD/FMN-containing dehydrogenase
MEKKALFKAITNIVPIENVSIKEFILYSYRKDWSVIYKSFELKNAIEHSPDIVVRPENTEQIIKIFKFANREKIPITPYSGGTGLLGAAIPSNGGILLDMKSMNKILEINEDDHSVRVQPGINLEFLNNELKKRNLLLGHDPWSRPSATVGGCISTNSVGYRATKYKSMGEQVLGLEVVLPTGNLIRTRAVPKSSMGLDLKQLFIGTEGIFGLITEAVIQVFPLYEKRNVLGFIFENFNTCFDTLVKLFKKGLVPASFSLEEELPEMPNANATLLIVFEGIEEIVEVQSKILKDHCIKNNGKEMRSRSVKKKWDERHISLQKLAKNLGLNKIVEYHGWDLNVGLPVNFVKKFRNISLEICRKYNIRVIDTDIWNNLNDFTIEVLYSSKQRESAIKAHRELVKETHKLGGTMEAVHGVGLAFKRYMEKEHGIWGVDIMKKIKRALDPNNILNPGKQIDIE